VPDRTPADSSLFSPTADLVFTYIRIGPNALSNEVWSELKQVWIKPMKDRLRVGGVLPIGVLQHTAYHRSIPFVVRRIQVRFSMPSVNVILAGIVWMILVPPFHPVFHALVLENGRRLGNPHSSTHIYLSLDCDWVCPWVCHNHNKSSES